MERREWLGKREKKKKEDGLKDERANTGHKKREPSCEYIYKNVILTLFPYLENTSNVFLVFITPHLKIRELSDENKN